MSNESILGSELETHKRLAFERRFAFVLANRGAIGRYRDRRDFADLASRVRAARGAFVPGENDDKRLVEIEGEINGTAIDEKLEIKLLDEAAELLRSLDPATYRHGDLARIVEAGRDRRLTRSELRDLQFLLWHFGGARYRDDGDTDAA